MVIVHEFYGAMWEFMGCLVAKSVGEHNSNSYGLSTLHGNVDQQTWLGDPHCTWFMIDRSVYNS